ncbi:DUF2339 domain-containing protein [Lentiprolixibacter aurantiacus]|uniref:DUF2339 domain-containing protein n=1 Tax=Lentiprolixibacter aurantiacus TaxID=2993939 RepID=A0AAE3SMM2_9FLAO|nr:DUF2339 domain-containing protein [Lentiprolixibacter aurantiacus]MCX2718441.1 DUF2339 domain-containing protein [Lentiprolixibacter aurantiacus]
MDNQTTRIKALQLKLEELLKRQEAFSQEISELRDAISALQEENVVEEAIPPTSETETVKEPAPEVTREFAASKPPEYTTAEVPGKRRSLYRKQPEKILGGVCSGLAEYVGMPTWLMRSIWVLFSLLFCIGAIIYIILWAAIPVAPGTYPVMEKAPSPDAEKPTKIPDSPSSQEQEPPTPGPITSSRAVFNLEKYIGESLISKIGMVVLIIGAAIGVKYSIDNDLISPTVRIILGYLLGISLLFIGGRLKQKYETFSAILVSGAMAILYFMTFAAYLFYGMFPQWVAFALMVVFTVATVGIALKYDRQIIAHLGLVGAYCIPFLLDEGRGEPAVLFSYVAIINLGILFIAFRKYWKPLYLFSFGVTWLIYCSWFVFNFSNDEHSGMAAFFAFLFFLIFYITFLAYKFIKKEVFNVLDVFLLLANSFIFFGFGYSIIEQSPEGASYLGAFTLFNALLHGIVSFVAHRFKLADKNIFYLVTGLVLVFITISIPVQLDGNWVTLLWAGEAVLLFHIGRTKNAGVYESMAYPLITLFALSLIHDWGDLGMAARFADETNTYTPFFNRVFLTSLLSAAALGYINFLFYKLPSSASWVKEQGLYSLISYGLGGLLIGVLYTAFSIEISNYWNQLSSVYSFPYQGSSYQYVRDAASFKAVWQLNFTLVFLSLLGVANNWKFKSRSLGIVSLSLNALALLSFLTSGLFLLSELRESYLEASITNETLISGFHIGIRYLSFVFLALFLFTSYKTLNKGYVSLKKDIVFDLVLAVTLCWIITSELLHWLDLADVVESYKLWLSILWGLYAMGLISLGIWKKKKHLRIGAIGLFSLTLVKLFFYDIAHLNTLSKTIVFVSLGIILLLVSYLYNRFKNIITDD